MLPPCSCRWYKHIPPFPTLCCFSSTDLLFQIRRCFPAYSYTLTFPERFFYWKSFVYPLVGIWIIAPADPSCRSTEGWSPLGTAWNYCTANLRGAPSKDSAPFLSFSSLSEMQVCILAKKMGALFAGILLWQRDRLVSHWCSLTSI